MSLGTYHWHKAKSFSGTMGLDDDYLQGVEVEIANSLPDPYNAIVIMIIELLRQHLSTADKGNAYLEVVVYPNGDCFGSIDIDGWSYRIVLLPNMMLLKAMYSYVALHKLHLDINNPNSLGILIKLVKRIVCRKR